MSALCRMMIGLLQLKGVGRQKVKRLMDLLSEPDHLTFREIIEFGQTFHIISSQINRDEIDKAIDYADKLIHGCESLSIKVSSYLDQGFPDCLRSFNDHPVLLFYQGNLDVLNQPKRAAIVGSRNPTPFGTDFAFQAGKILAEKDFVVISGLAAGADTSGHQGCLSVGGKTVAFLPSGLSQVYPHQNKKLADKILSQNGCLISEYSHFETVQPYKFIERDRLQSGTSLFVIVSNFSPGSGTIHTLGFAEKYKRPVYSIPIIYEESKDGFEVLNNTNISFQILDNAGLKKVIENY
ncbi:MAG: DNA-protecting protein DprA [Firmicutes bacterium]|nr:DNA-protecting protein DprA [Bacillota bacterium]